MNCIFLRRGYPETESGPKIDYSDNFADNDWSKIIEVCQAGLVPTTWKVGDQKAMTINGTSYPIDIIGIQHDDYADGSGKAPFTFQMHDCYGTSNLMNLDRTNSGGYASCKMHTTYLPEIMDLMPSEVKSNIKPVNKLTSAGNDSSNIETTSCNTFLISEIEAFGSVTFSQNGEGSQYEYYKAGYSRKKAKAGSFVVWWLRSPNLTSKFCRVDTIGDAGTANANTSYGIAFAFCF